jgi:para-nitrobenzyl esterase
MSDEIDDSVALIVSNIRSDAASADSEAAKPTVTVTSHLVAAGDNDNIGDTRAAYANDNPLHNTAAPVAAAPAAAAAAVPAPLVNGVSHQQAERKHQIETRRRSRAVICAAIVFSAVIIGMIAAFGKSPDAPSSGSIPHQVRIQVETACGPVQTYAATGIAAQAAAFRGIPFAEPPVGNLRWKPAQNKTTCWQGVFNATESAKPCIQFFTSSVQGQSEDCLYLNVYTPITSVGALPEAGSLPVMFYIYGGSLTSGQTSDIDFGPLATDLNVVIVNVNYRLGLLGFLAHPLLTQHDSRNTSGNYGFTDQAQALRWVNENVAGFGGDPTRVTIFGQSSGGTSVYALMAMPEVKGLFHRAYSMSGSPNMSMPLTRAYVQNQPIIDASGCSTYDCLLALNVSTIASLIPLSWSQPLLFGLPLPNGLDTVGLSIVDGVTIQKPLLQALAQPVHPGVPFIVGTMGQEVDLEPNANVYSDTRNDFNAFLNDSFSSVIGWTIPNLANIVRNLYADDIDVNPQLAYDRISNDAGIMCANIQLACAAGDMGFAYVFEQGPSRGVINTVPPIHYAFHLWDLMVGARIWNYLGVNYTPDAIDMQLSTLLRDDVWSKLAYSGTVSWKPACAQVPPNNGNGRVPDAYNVAVIDQGKLVEQHNFRKNYCDFWERQVGLTPSSWWTN